MDTWSALAANLVGSLEDAAHGVVELLQQILHILLDGSQLAGILLGDHAGQIAVGQTLGHGHDILDGVMQNFLGGTYGVADAADLILGLVLQRVGQIALAEGHHGLLGLTERPDDGAHGQQVEGDAGQNADHHQHHEDDDFQVV